MKTGFVKRETDGYVYFTSAVLEDTGLVSHGFSTRRGGVSKGVYESLNLGFGRGDSNENVMQNFSIACAALGIDSRELTFSRQIHSSIVRAVTKSERGLENLKDIPEGDALITNVSNLPLAVFYADCVPILLLDPKKEVVAAVHSGWRGTAQGIVKKAVLKMGECFSSSPSDILAAIGPCIGPCCYKVGSEVYSAFHSACGDNIKSFFSSSPQGDIYLDLKGANSYLLEQAGVTPHNICAAKICTCCERDIFYSHRRDGQLRGNHAAFIMLCPKGVNRNA